MELVTGYLSDDQLESEFAEIALILARLKFPVLIVTYGGGCDWSKVSTDLHPTIASLLLPEFIAQQEEAGIFYLGGRNDVVFDTNDGKLRFLLCEVSEIHCETNDVKLFELFCERWQRAFADAYELDRMNGRMRLLSQSEWKRS